MTRPGEASAADTGAAAIGSEGAGASAVRDDGLIGSTAGLWGGHARMGGQEAVRVAELHWGLPGRATRVDTEKDDTFIIESGGPGRHVLKVTNPAEDIAEVDFEVQLLRHAGESSTLVPVQRLFPDRAGQVLVPLVDDAGQQRHARLMSYMEGTPLDSTDASPAERAQVGEALGNLRHSTATFTHPAQYRVLAWDVQHLPGLRPLLAVVADPAQRDLLEAGLARYDLVAPVLPSLRRQVLHNDFSKSNIIVCRGSARFVQGIIDFGDAVHTAVAIDVATALLNQLPRSVPDSLDVDLFADARDLLRGYLSVADLTPAELAAIPYLVMGRVIARAIITTHRAVAMPSNARYILRNTEPGWAQLRWFLAQSDTYLESLL
jgi:Ser/Thr protein kinase RdoA (MazF antagonist)